MAVCVLGSINRDVICRVAALPRPGETVAARETLRLPGGKGANQAVAAARMGAATRMIGAVGADADGAALTAWLAGEGIDVTGVARHVSAPTGAAYIALDDAGENQILVSPGANAAIAPEAATIRPGDRVCLAQLETPVAAVAAFFARAGAAGALRILNAAPALAEGAALFAATDLLIVNQSELARYAGLAGTPDAARAIAAARALLTRGDHAVVVTLGGAGAVLVDRDESIDVAGRRVPVIDTTGAGDCFCGALAALLADGMARRQALALANAAAALCVQRAGAGPAMPSLGEVTAFADAAI